ncbi:17353_t:CDS:2 [Cetraspora pellucida]|uniref:17353_t:CDS:1 n=1 Tax=Cetraspora pellucida TaxID=1433469 RepID=A0A9N8WSI6_9GLOM|nr:17353_t:CDS:2 [Cetraspora pellucida]
MPTLSCDPAYSQLLDMNQKLHDELQDEISINKSNKRKICSLVKKLEQYYRTISLQDNIIIVHEKVIKKFKSKILICKNSLRSYNKIKNLKIRGVSTPMQNPVNVIDSIRGSLNTIQVTLQNITAEHDQYQDLLNNTNRWIERTVRERDNAQEEQDLAILAYNNDKKESCHWYFSYQNKDKHIILQNNLLQNMAAIEHVIQTLALYLASLPAYDGQETPDSYYVKLRNINEITWPMAVTGFDAVTRINNMKKFLNWLQGKFQEVMIGTNQATLKALMSENVLPYLYNHIPINMQLKIKITNSADLNAFFIKLRNIWLEAGEQCSEFLDYNNGGLEKRLKRIEAHVVKFARKDTRGAKTPQHQCSESSPFGRLEKRLEQIEALITKLIKKSKFRSSQLHMATKKKVNYTEQCEYSDKSLKSKVSNKSELRKVKQDNNSSFAHNASSDKDSHGKHVSLEKTICKIIQIEFKNYLPYIIKQTKKCISALAHDSNGENILDGSIEIDFVKKKEPTTSIVSIKCKIKYLKIPAMVLDSCVKLLIITPDIIEHVGYEINKFIKHDLSGIATVLVKSIGVVHNLLITLVPGFTIYKDFIVVKYSKPMLIFSNPLLKKYKCAID